MNLSEAFKQLDCLNEDVFEVSDKGIEELKDFRDSDDSDDTIEVIDPEAENKEEIKDSYVGKIICQCNVCKSLVYFDKDNIQIDEENGTVNADEECPFCFTNSGYSIVGEVAPYSDYQVEATDEDGNKVDVEVEVDGKKVSTNESMRIKRGKKQVKRFNEGIGASDFDYFVHVTDELDDFDELYNAMDNAGIGNDWDGDADSGFAFQSIQEARNAVEQLKSIGYNAEYHYDPHEDDYDDMDESYVNESIDLSVTDYEGILKFVTKGVQVDGKIHRSFGTGDLEIDITPDDDSINKVISAAESIGFNEVDRVINDGPMQGDSWVVLTKQSREGRCLLGIVFNADHDYAFVDAGYDEDEDYEYFNESLENVKLDTGDQEIEISGLDWADESCRTEADVIRSVKNTFGRNAKVTVETMSGPGAGWPTIAVKTNLDDLVSGMIDYCGGDDDCARELLSDYIDDSLLAPYFDDDDSEIEEKDEKLSLGKRKNESIRGNKMRKNCSESLDSIKLDDGNQEIEIKTKKKEDLPKDSMMVPPSDDTLEDILSDEESEVEEPVEDEEIDEEPMPEDGDIVDVDVDEVEDESFNRLGESFLKKVYENVKSFRTTSAATNGNTLVLEGLITFKSGKSKPTTFKFEANKINSKGKIRFLGENKDISSGRKSFALNCKVSKKAIIPESMTYNYVARGLNESQRVTGTVRLNESTRIRRR